MGIERDSGMKFKLLIFPLPRCLQNHGIKWRYLSLSYDNGFSYIYNPILMNNGLPAFEILIYTGFLLFIAYSAHFVASNGSEGDNITILGSVLARAMSSTA